MTVLDQEDRQSGDDAPMLLDCSQSEYFVNTLSIGSKTGLILAHAHFASTGLSTEENVGEQFGYNAYQTDSPMTFTHGPITFLQFGAISDLHHSCPN